MLFRFFVCIPHWILAETNSAYEDVLTDAGGAALILLIPILLFSSFLSGVWWKVSSLIYFALTVFGNRCGMPSLSILFH